MKSRVVPIIAVAAALISIGACTGRQQPPRTTTTSTTMGPHDGTGGHDMPGGDKPYTSPDDPRLSPAQQQRAKDLIARTAVGMQKFRNETDLILNGYQSIKDQDSGFEHYVKWALLHDGKELDANAIESVVLEVKPGQAKRIIAAMYFLEDGKSFADAPDIAGPLTVWHNHKDLCWDATGHTLLGVYRLGRCIPLGTVRTLNPMIHVWVVPNQCGPFAEIDDMNGTVDKYLRSIGAEPPRDPNQGCAHVHGGDHN